MLYITLTVAKSNIYNCYIAWQTFVSITLYIFTVISQVHALPEALR